MAADVATLAAELAAHVDAGGPDRRGARRLERHPGTSLAAGTCTGVRAAVGGRERHARRAVGGLRGLPHRARRAPAPRRRAPPTVARGHRRGAGWPLPLDCWPPAGHRRCARPTPSSQPPTTRTGHLHRVGAARRPGPGGAGGGPVLDPDGAAPRGSRVRSPTSSGRSSTTRWRWPASPVGGARPARRRARVRVGAVRGARRRGTGGRPGSPIWRRRSAAAPCTARLTGPDGGPELVADADPPAPDPLPSLRARSRRFSEFKGGPRGRRGAGSAGRRHGRDGGAAHRRRRGRGLVERRPELRGRFDAYRAKAARSARRGAGRARGGACSTCCGPARATRGGHRGGRRLPAAGPGRSLTVVSASVRARGLRRQHRRRLLRRVRPPGGSAGPGGGSGPAPADACGRAPTPRTRRPGGGAGPRRWPAPAASRRGARPAGAPGPARRRRPADRRRGPRPRRARPPTGAGALRPPRRALPPARRGRPPARAPGRSPRPTRRRGGRKAPGRRAPGERSLGRGSGRATTSGSPRRARRGPRRRARGAPRRPRRRADDRPAGARGPPVLPQVRPPGRPPPRRPPRPRRRLLRRGRRAVLVPA